MLVQNSQGHLSYLQMAGLSITISDNLKVKRKSTGGLVVTGNLRIKSLFLQLPKMI